MNLGDTSLSRALIERKLITPEELENALSQSHARVESLGKTLIELGYLTEEQFYSLLSDHLDIPFVRLSSVAMSPDVIASVSPDLVHKYQIFPVKREGRYLYVATGDPCNVALADELRHVLKCEVTLLAARREEITAAIKAHYGLGAETLRRMAGRDEAPAQPNVDSSDDLHEVAADGSVIRLVNQILLDAYQSRATDIHLEPYEDELRLRYRIDGILYPVSVSQEVRRYQDAVTSRIKVMASLNIAEKRLPQDGRIKVRLGKEELNLRVSILPTPYGESVQIRLLSTNIYQMQELGLAEEDLKTVERIIRKPHGIVLVTGPTGSGKTTTLYACLSKLNSDDRKIITIEDPIEYQMKGIAQIQVHPAIGLTFAQGLRSMLRHDPDVMMVGEIRDDETAEIAIRVALTGHLVMSTLHTNDAPGAVTRLLDMGIEPYLISSSVECIVAQRLVRVICPHCKAEEKLLDELRVVSDMPAVAYVGRGCDVCKQTGYRGRTGIHEVLIMNDEIKSLVLRRASADEIREAGIRQGMQTLRVSGLEKVARGITTISEVLKVTQEI